MAAKAIPCKKCGRPTDMLGTKLCSICWELNSKIRFLASEIGYEYTEKIVVSFLAEASAEEKKRGGR